MKDGVYLELGSLEIPPLRPEPSENDVDEALKWMGELFGEFHFNDLQPDGSTSRDASHANAFAMMITPFVRRFLTSCTPLFLIEKPHENAGATLLSTLPTLIFEGIETSGTTFPKSEEEREKVVVGKFRDGSGVIRYDNVTTLISQRLKSDLTSPILEGRILGTNVICKRANNYLWIATGIKPLLDKEMARRVCCVRLDAAVENPQALKYKKDLKVWVVKNRPQLVWAILTLINNWRAKGMPEFEERTLSSFEHWAKVIGGILEACGVNGFLSNPREVNAGSEFAELRECAKLSFYRWAFEKCEFDQLAKWAIDVALPLVIGYDENEKRKSFRTVLNSLEGRTFDFLPDDPKKTASDKGVSLVISDDGGTPKYHWRRVKGTGE